MGGVFGHRLFAFGEVDAARLHGRWVKYESSNVY